MLNGLAGILETAARNRLTYHSFIPVWRQKNEHEIASSSSKRKRAPHRGEKRETRNAKNQEKDSPLVVVTFCLFFSLCLKTYIHTHIRVSFSVLHDENLEETGRMTAEEEKNKPGIIFGKCKSRTMQFHRASFFTTRSIF